MQSTVVRRVLCTSAVLVTALGLASGPLAAAAPAPEASAAAVDLRVTVDFADVPYQVGEPVVFTVSLTNHGSTPATEVQGATLTEGGVRIPAGQWGEFEAGGTVAPGATAVVELSADTSAATPGRHELTISVFAPNDLLDDNTVRPLLTIAAPPPGDLAGVLYGDRDGDGAYDPGEGLAGALVQVSPDPGVAAPRTDAAGRFGYDGIPAGRYRLTFTDVPAGWLVGSAIDLDVIGGVPADVVHVRAVRPLTEQLAASLDLTADTYRPGATAGIRLTLTNRGPTAVDGVLASCQDDDQGGVPVVGLGPEWARLTTGPGVTVPAGGMLVLDLTGTVGDRLADFGHAIVDCRFGPANGVPAGFPRAEDRARVAPGRTADSVGVIYHDADRDGAVDPGEPLAGVRVGIIDPDTGVVIAKATTGADGRLTLRAVPAGLLLVRPYGPWARLPFDDGLRQFGPAGQREWYFGVVPGPVVPEDPGPPQGSPGGGLPNTGVSVLGLTVVGGGLVGFGVSAVLAARRRRAPAGRPTTG